MTARIIKFPNSCTTPPPKTERQQRHERIAELLCERAKRKGIDCSIEKARAAFTQALIEFDHRK